MKDNTTISFEIVQKNGTPRLCRLQINASDSYLFDLNSGMIYQNSTYSTLSCSGDRMVRAIRAKMVNGTVYIKSNGRWLNTGTSSMRPLLRYNPVSLALSLSKSSECILDADHLKCNLTADVLRSLVSYYLGLPGNVAVRSMEGYLDMKRSGSIISGVLVYRFDVSYQIGSGVEVEQKGSGKEDFTITVR